MPRSSHSTSSLPPRYALWGGRFGATPSKLMQHINASIGVDQRLYAYDIASSQAHVQMLVAQKLLTQAEGKKLRAGLTKIKKELDNNNFVFREELEDIHTHIEARLAKLIGPLAGKLQTARSRNDQIATDMRLYLRDMLARLGDHIANFQHILATQALAHAQTLMPGFTHLQIAQPISYGHYLLAYVEMLGRDAARFDAARSRLNESPLGAAAIAGTSLPIDRRHTAKALKFAQPMANSIDAVSARDFVIEALGAASICATHLSRLAEEVVIFASPAYGFFRLPDALSTGSSLMPQKRNPDAAELVRAKTGRIIGALTNVLIMMKGLPLAYAKDMQEDKAACFDAMDNLDLCLQIMAQLMHSMGLNTQRMAAQAADGHSTATDLADWLVRAHMPFRTAHDLVGRLVRLAEKKDVPLHKLALSDMQKISPLLTQDIYAVLDATHARNARTSLGGTAPARVRTQARRWLAQLKTQRRPS